MGNKDLSVHKCDPAKFRTLGVKGYSCVLRKLPYTCPNNLFVVPVAHALLYGVVRDITRYVLEEGKHKNKRYVLTKLEKQ